MFTKNEIWFLLCFHIHQWCHPTEEDREPSMFNFQNLESETTFTVGALELLYTTCAPCITRVSIASPISVFILCYTHCPPAQTSLFTFSIHSLLSAILQYNTVNCDFSRHSNYIALAIGFHITKVTSPLTPLVNHQPEPSQLWIPRVFVFPFSYSFLQFYTSTAFSVKHPNKWHQPHNCRVCICLSTYSYLGIFF